MLHQRKLNHEKNIKISVSYHNSYLEKQKLDIFLILL